MKAKQRWVLLGAVVVLALVAAVAIYGFLGKKHTESAKPVVIGVVKLDKVVPLHPSYGQYEALKKEYNRIEAEYRAQQESLTGKAQEQALALRAIGMDQALTDSLNTELAAKIAAKEEALNMKLAHKRRELIEAYLKDMKVAPSAVDLRIVNLQLELTTLTKAPVLDDTQAAAQEKAIADKKAELDRLLAERKVSPNAAVNELEAKVNAALQPMREEGQKELDAYAKSLHEELAKRRQEMIQDKADAYMKQNALPDPVAWNTEWEARLSRQKEAVDAMHEAILEDIRTRVAVVAESRGLTLVVTNEVSNVNGVDITDAVIASYE